MRGRGRGSSNARRGRSRTMSNATSIDHDDDSSKGIQLCVSCSRDVGENPIGCDKCEHWVHCTEMCSGLPQRMIDAIIEYEGTGISFVCTKCRIKRESSSSNNAQPLMVELVTQIFQQMKGLCNTVQSLMDQVKVLSSKPPAPAPMPTPAAPTPPSNPMQDDYKASIQGCNVL